MLDLAVILTVLGIAATLIAPAAGYILKLRKEHRNYYSLIWKKSSKIKTKELLGERPYEEYYFERNIDSLLARAIERKRNALIIGPPLSGKTRAVFNALKNSKSPVDILIPRAVAMPVFQFPTDYRFWRDKLIFIDDLQYFTEKQDNYHLLFRKAKEAGIPVIAACHSGREYKKVKNKMIEQNLDVDIIFGEDIVELEKISADEGKKVAEKMGMKWDNVKFNGTIGSIFMKLSEMEKRYDNSDNVEKTILRSIRSLYLAGVFEDNNIFRLDWIKKTALRYELEGRDFEWTGWMKALEGKEFIKITRRNKIWAEDAYLEYVVKPEVETTLTDVLEEITEIFSDTPEVLQMAGERAYDIGTIDPQIADYMKIAISAFEKILEITDKETNELDYTRAQNYLGQAYWSLSKVQDTHENCMKSMAYFNEILKTISIESNPFEYAKIKNRIGNTFTAFAEVENREENCKIAIAAFDESLKVLTLENSPLDYGQVCNNMGGAYLILGELGGMSNNYKTAIKLFNEALKVRTITKYPKDYALTKNNVANSYAKLSYVEEPEKNLQLAIEAYEDVLKIHTEDKYPQQFAVAKNNIGNAYSMLADIKDTELNCKKSIEAYEKSLEVRTFELAPRQYANTMSNLGDVYILLSQLDKNPEYLDKALEAFEESLKVRTLESYPFQYAEVQYMTGKAYVRLAEIEDKSDNYHKAIRAFDEALKVFTEENSPAFYIAVQEEISRAKKIFFV